MCLYIDDYDDDGVFLGSGTRTARKTHARGCGECGRDIDPGERYRYWTWAWEGTADTSKICAHCDATIDLGHALTGCPKQWNGGMLWDRDYEIGYVANIIDDPGHTIHGAERLAMLRCVAAARRKWRWSDGRLMPVPQMPAQGGASLTGLEAVR